MTDRSCMWHDTCLVTIVIIGARRPTTEFFTAYRRRLSTDWMTTQRPTVMNALHTLHVYGKHGIRTLNKWFLTTACFLPTLMYLGLSHQQCYSNSAVSSDELRCGLKTHHNSISARSNFIAERVINARNGLSADQVDFSSFPKFQLSLQYCVLTAT